MVRVEYSNAVMAMEAPSDPLAGVFAFGDDPHMLCLFCGAGFGPVERADACQHVMLECRGASVATRQAVHDATQSLLYPAWQHFRFPSDSGEAQCRLCAATLSSRMTPRLCAHLMFTCGAVSDTVMRAVVDAGVGTDSPFSTAAMRSFTEVSPGKVRCRHCDAEVSTELERDVFAAARTHCEACPECPDEIKAGLGTEEADTGYDVDGDEDDGSEEAAELATRERARLAGLIGNCFQPLESGQSRCTFCFGVRAGSLGCLKRHLLVCKKAPGHVRGWLDQHTLVLAALNRRGPPRLHPVWQHFSEVGFLRAECQFCSEVVQGDVQAKRRHLARCERTPEAVRDFMGTKMTTGMRKRAAKVHLHGAAANAVFAADVAHAQAKVREAELAKGAGAGAGGGAQGWDAHNSSGSGAGANTQKVKRKRRRKANPKGGTASGNGHTRRRRIRVRPPASQTHKWPMVLQQLRALGSRPNGTIVVPATEHSTAVHHLAPASMATDRRAKYGEQGVLAAWPRESATRVSGFGGHTRATELLNGHKHESKLTPDPPTPQSSA